MKIRWGLLIVLAITLSAGIAAPTIAAPKDVAGQAAATGSTAIPYQLTVRGASGRAEAQVSLPEGSTPITFSAVVNSTYQTPGKIVFTSGQRQAAERSADASGPINFEVLPSDMSNGTVTIAMFAQLDSVEDCFSGDNQQATLNDAKLTYSYQAQNIVSVGTFLSIGIDSYQVVLPADPTEAEQAAGLTAVSSLGYRYLKPTRVSLIATATPPPATFLNRQVTIKEGQPPNGATNTVAVTPDGQLAIVGTPDGLSGAAAALASPNTDVLESASVTNLSATPDFARRTGIVSLEDLQIPPVTLAGVGKQSALMAFDQPLFGQNVQDLTLLLSGTITALPSGGQGRVDYIWNGELIESREMSSNTRLSESLKISKEQVARQNQLEIDLLYVPPGTKCAPPGISARLDVSATASYVDVVPGTSLVPGFQRFPQTLPGSVPVAFGAGGSTAELIQQAGSLVAALTQGWPQQLVFQRTTIDEALGSRASAIVVGSTDELTKQLDAPLKTDGAVSIGDQAAVFGAGTDSPFAYVQAFAEGDRDLIILGHRDATGPALAINEDLANKLAAYVYDNKDGWQALTRQVAVMGTNGQLQELELQQPIVDKAAIILVATGIGLVVVLAVLLVWLWLRPRRGNTVEE